MSASPSLTVLMTVYNAGRHLKPAIQSILSQSFRDFEFLAVDDASTDGSLEVLQRFAAVDPRFRIIANTVNKGQTACLNQGLREAKGKWIARQDADDLSLPGRLAAQWEAARSSPDLVLVGVNGWIIDEAGKVSGMIHAPLHDSGIRWSMPFRNPFIHTGVMFRRGDGFYDEEFRICQDWEFWQRLAERGRMRNLPGRLVAYRHSASSLSHASADRTRQESGEIVSRIWRSRFGSEPREPKLLEEFREGLRVENQKRFWKFYSEMRGRRSRGNVRQAAAVHHVQVAGAFAGCDSRACFVEMFSALSESPIWTARLIWERILLRPNFGNESPASSTPH